MTEININSNGRPLVRVSFETLDDITIESNLSEAGTSEAIAKAMEQLARSIGAEDQARSEAAAARTEDPTAGPVAKAMARMVSEMLAAMPVPEVNVDLGDWVPATPDAN
jgi:hypothetical protein